MQKLLRVVQQISVSQFGFMRHHYSLQQLFIFVNKIINAFENERNYDVIYLVEFEIFFF